MDYTKEIPVSQVSSFLKHPHRSPQVFRVQTASEAPPSACPFELSALGLSSLITHQDILALSHFLSSHSCIKNLANKSLIMLYYVFSTLWQIPFYCGFLEIILDFKMPMLSGREVQTLSGARRALFSPSRLPKLAAFYPVGPGCRLFLLESQCGRFWLLMLARLWEVQSLAGSSWEGWKGRSVLWIASFG